MKGDGIFFAQVPESVLYSDKLNGTDVRLYAILLRWETWNRPITRGDLAHLLNASEDTVDRAVSRLVDAQFITWTRGQYEIRYTINRPLPDAAILRKLEMVRNRKNAGSGQMVSSRRSAEQTPQKRGADSANNRTVKRKSAASPDSPFDSSDSSSSSPNGEDSGIAVTASGKTSRSPREWQRPAVAQYPDTTMGRLRYQLDHLAENLRTREDNSQTAQDNARSFDLATIAGACDWLEETGQPYWPRNIRAACLYKQRTGTYGGVSDVAAVPA